MSVLNVSSLTLRIAGRTLLEGADLTVDPGRKVGLVGRNGAGKSTLLKAISGEIGPDAGSVRLANRVRLGRVAQEAPSGPLSLLETVLAADTERAGLLAEAETAAPERLADIHDRLRAIEADSAPARAGAILSGLGFDAAAQARPVKSFSGGWRMRVALAAVLFTAPDLLLLDEPTNHLDLEATLWLEEWIRRFPGAAIIVSHDRSLLDNTVDAIAHLDQRKITMYPGGYEAFVRIRTERAEHDAKAVIRIAAARAHLQSFVDRFRAKASKARQAQSKLKAIARLPPVPTVGTEAETQLSFPPPPERAPPLLAMDRAAVGYGGTAVLRDISLRLDPDDRIALLGRNGNGKTTLARLMAGELPTMAGEVRRTPRLGVGFFAQHQTETLDLAATPLVHLQRLSPTTPDVKLRSQLARFGLDADRANTPVGSLSGGEKARLALALATREAPGLLILDEPTNHLDIDAREALVRALADFSGAVVLISHDPHLVGLVADRLLLVDGGKVAPFDGDMDDYRAFLLSSAKPAPKQVADTTRGGDRRGRAEARAAVAPLRKRAQDAERRIAELAAERARIEKRLADPGIYAPGRASDVITANLRLAAIKSDVAKAEADWLAAQEALEAAAA